VDTNAEIRKGVIASLPEAQKIKDDGLRELVYDAWALALSKSSFTRIEDMPGSAVPDAPELKGATQADHLNGVARIAAAMAQALKESVPEFDVSMDEVIAVGLCHDLGKPFEYDPENRKRWGKDHRVSGRPAFRHTLYGVHIALTAGLPEQIAHIAGTHSPEGELVTRSLGCEVVHAADHAYWGLLRSSGLLGN
jgi:putative nucleotidyltransferase with HDIG domain